MDATERFMALFDGLDRAYGTYNNIAKEGDSSGKKKGQALTKREPVTRELWEGHLRGENGIGIIPIRDDNSAKFGAVDVDAYKDFDPAKTAAKALNLGLPVVVCRSKSGGAHLYLFAIEPTPAAKMRARLQDIASLLGFGNSEIFPKQSQILADRGDVGGWINMPYFGGLRGMRYALKPSGDAFEQDEFLTYAERLRVAPDFFDNPLVVQGDGARWVPDGPPCLQQLVTIRIQEGMRNNGLYSFGVYLKKAFPEEWRQKLLEYARLFCEPAPPDNEVKGVIISLERKEYHYGCQKPPLVSYCNSAVCRTRKHGVGSGETGGFPELGQLRKLLTVPPIWFWDMGGKPVELTTEELQTPRRFQAKVMEALDTMPTLPSNTVWQRIVQDAMANVVFIEAPEDASVVGMFWDLLERFCTGRAQAQNREEILLGKPWTSEGLTWFRMTDLVLFLERSHFKAFLPNKIAGVLKSKDAKHDFWKIKGKGVNVWAVPEHIKPDSDYEVPDAVEEKEVL